MEKSLRSWIKKKAKQQECSISELLPMSVKRDPFYTGSKGQVRRAKWAAGMYEKYVKVTGETKVHSRGLHYFMDMRLKEEIKPPTQKCTWDHYGGTRTCWNYLSDSLVWAKRLGLIPWDAIIDEKNDVTRTTIYRSHSTGYRVGRPSSPIHLPLKQQLEVRMPSLWERKFDSFTDYVENQADRIASGALKEVRLDEDRLQPFHVEVWAEKNTSKT